MKQPITIEATINAPIEKVWSCWTESEHITQWCQASEDWYAPSAINDLKVGGKFKTRMEAKDGSSGFDFEGTYTAVDTHKLIEYMMSDRRKVTIEFSQGPEGVKIVEIFDPEDENPIEMQKAGWQAILDNFKKYVIV